jgi:RNA 2',3'-cyclic 3'-phosphodiesterase
MRLFVALDIDESIRQRIERFMEGVREFASEARWVRPESLHVTLKFIGEKPEDSLEAIKQALAGISSPPITVHLRGHGFFPNPKSARVFWIGLDADALSALAAKVDEVLSTVNIPREEHPFHPHLTLARSGAGSGNPRRQMGDRRNRDFQRLQEKLAVLAVPEFGTMTAHEFFLYQSQLGRGGSRYTKLQNFLLRS